MAQAFRKQGICAMVLLFTGVAVSIASLGRGLNTHSRARLSKGAAAWCQHFKKAKAPNAGS